MDALLAIAIVCVFYAIGDYVSYKTKAILSMLFVTSVIFLIAFWLGLPKSIFDDALISKIGNILVMMMLTHMGTLMNIKTLIKQWKTVLVALAAVTGILAALYLLGIPLVGREYALVAAPPIAGGVVASIMMSEAAKAKGLDILAVFSTLLLVLQGFFGYPIASICLKKEANRLLGVIRGGKAAGQADAAGAAAEIRPRYRFVPDLPKDLQTSFILLAKLAVVAFLAVQLAVFMNNVVHRLIVCLIFGIVAREFGFLEENIMVKANAFGLGMVAILSVVFVTLVRATPAMVLQLVWPIVATLVLGVIGIVGFSILIGRLIGLSLPVSIAIGATALFGFPGTFIISNEVSQAVGQTDAERKAILDEILPKMLVAGFITVSISSVILAGIMVKWL